jgi:hypothetical protein
MYFFWKIISSSLTNPPRSKSHTQFQYRYSSGHLYQAKPDLGHPCPNEYHSRDKNDRDVDNVFFMCSQEKKDEMTKRMLTGKNTRISIEERNSRIADL